MGKRVFNGLKLKDQMLLLTMASIVLRNGVDWKAQASETSLEVDRKLKFLNRPAVKSIQSEDGDIIDCVDIYKQPAFDHPALRNHTIQMRPSFNPPMEIPSTKNESTKKLVSQTWQKSGSCPNGTIPIRRIRTQDLLRATSLDNFGRKNPQTSNAANKTVDQDSRIVTLNNTKFSLGPQVNRSAAILVTQGYNFIGAKGDINVWNPNIESSDEFSAAQIWLKNGPRDCLESVESGWVVNPKLYGDKLTRFFTYWTADSSKETGCFDLTCSGFVQTSHQIALGAAFDPWSVEYGPQYQFTIYIYMDPNTSNWWLCFNNDINVGYWPGTIFSLLKHSATLVEWGGEIYSSKVRTTTPHTATAMGSGEFASGLYGVANYISHIRIVDYSLTFKYPQWVATWADEDNCYSAYNYIKGYLSEPVLYFGGPGRNYWCP